MYPNHTQSSIKFTPAQIFRWILLLNIFALYAILIIPTVNRLGIGWDEKVDLRIASAYLTRSGFFLGIPLDLSQTRLPMFFVAFVYRLLGELAALHLLVVFFKSTPVLGLALLVGTAVSLKQWRQHGVLLPLLVTISYSAGLLLLPLAQTFYTVVILPVLSLLAAYQFLRLWSSRRKIALILAALAIGWWIVEMFQSYPDYHLNGYQWVGERVLFGRSSIGYASVVFTPEDGVQQVMEWLNENAEPGQVAQLSINEWHIVRYFALNPVYKITNGLDEKLKSKPDYVVVHLNALHAQGFGKDNPTGDIHIHPFDEKELIREYQKVFSVGRAFGLEAASIWQRK